MTDNGINYDSIGIIVKELRTKQHMSKEELAERLDISVSHVCNIEKANAKTSLSIIVRIANLFNVPLDYILVDSIRNKSVATDYTHSNLWEGCNELQTEIILETATKLKEKLLKIDSLPLNKH